MVQRVCASIGPLLLLALGANPLLAQVPPASTEPLILVLPQTRPASTRPAAIPATRPAGRSATRPATRPATHPATRPHAHTLAHPTTRPTTRPAAPLTNASTTAPSAPATRAAIGSFKSWQVNLAWQVALEGSDFSPGILDAHFGRKSQVALREYAQRYFPGLEPLDPQVYESLKVQVDTACVAYTITEADQAMVGTLPLDWNAKAQLSRMPYDTLLDGLGEKFHATRALLGLLNPGVSLNALRVGQVIMVPNIRPFPSDLPTRATPSPIRSQVESLHVNLGEKIIRALDHQGRTLALFHCSIARDKAKLPTRDARIKTLALNPNYTFDPRHWPEVHNVDRVLIIPPGPRNPVGLAWIGLDLPGYGIHGNPMPELIGKTGSHGCFRMTNWDAVKLFSMVRMDLPVKMSGTVAASELEAAQ